MAATTLRVIFVTAPMDKAEGLARQLLEERLIACANLVPRVRSLYGWDGKIQDEPETLLIMKTPKRRVQRLLERVRELHPYEVPEILALPVEAAHPPYAEWAERETRETRDEG